MYTLAKCTFLLCAFAACTGFALGPVDVVFHLFNRANPASSVPLLPTVESIGSTNQFGPNRRTIITIHDFSETAGGNFNAFLMPAHLAAEDVNFIAVDWSRGSSMYSEGLGNAPQVGDRIADFIRVLQSPFNYDLSLIRIVGVGLGGHIAGIAARQFQGQINHIVSIDPSLVGWTHHPDRLNADDAGVVEVLYATAGITGYDHPLGDLNFYANGGTHQNGCGTDASCSRTFGYAFYAESLGAEANDGLKFVGSKCEDYEDAIALTCSGERDVYFGGTAVKSDVSGIYIFTTNPSPPFARG